MAVAVAPYDEYWFQPLVTGGYQNFVYVVYWPDTGVIKAGVTSYSARWRKFCRRGAMLLAVIPNGRVATEKQIEDWFARIGPRAFGSWGEAVSHLGAGGCGYTECYRIKPDDLHDIIEYLREVDSGLVQSR